MLLKPDPGVFVTCFTCRSDEDIEPISLPYRPLNIHFACSKFKLFGSRFEDFRLVLRTHQLKLASEKENMKVSL